MNDLISLISEADDFCSLGKTSGIRIVDAENMLDLQFAQDYKEYLAAFGAASFNAKELTGISKSNRLSVVAATERARHRYPFFPADAYVIEDMLIDHKLIIQKSNGKVFLYGSNDSSKEIAQSLLGYLFPSKIGADTTLEKLE